MKSPLRQKLYSIANRLCGAVPTRLRLPYQCLILRTITTHEREAFNLKKIGPCGGTAVDVGANFGLYSWYLSKLYDDVVAFEPNVEIARPLVDARLPNVQLKTQGLSSEVGEAKLWIPIANGIVMGGWASLNRHNHPDADKHLELHIKLDPLDSFRLDNVKFMKIDVEGHEHEVLLGAEKTIRKFSPHIVVEVQDSNLALVRSTLTRWNYREVTLDSLGGGVGSSQNLIFLPNSVK